MEKAKNAIYQTITAVTNALIMFAHDQLVEGMIVMRLKDFDPLHGHPDGNFPIYLFKNNEFTSIDVEAYCEKGDLELTGRTAVDIVKDEKFVPLFLHLKPANCWENADLSAKFMKTPFVFDIAEPSSPYLVLREKRLLLEQTSDQPCIVGGTSEDEDVCASFKISKDDDLLIKLH